MKSTVNRLLILTSIVLCGFFTIVLLQSSVAPTEESSVELPKAEYQLGASEDLVNQQGPRVCEAVECAECCPCDARGRKVDVLGYGLYSWGQSVGICDSYGSFGALISTCSCFPCSTALADVSFHVTDKGKFGASTGVGFHCGDECCYDGYFIYYDYLEGRIGKFHQLGFSYEKIQDYYEFRLNAYLPVDIKGKRKLDKVFDDYDSTGVTPPYKVKAFCNERPFTGFDIEAGSHCRTECFDAYAGFGLYYFGRDCCKDVLGMKGVMRLFCGQYFEAQGQVTWDKCNRVLLRGQIALTLPFDLICDPCGFKSCCIRPLNRVYRDGPIHLDRCCQFKTNF